MDINEILNSEVLTPSEKVEELTYKEIKIREWNGEKGLQKEYDPKEHPVMNTANYPDIISGGKLERVTRIPLAFQKLATKRMSELLVGIPVKRVYDVDDDNELQQEVATFIEKIFEKNRIDSVNTQRSNMLFAGCEVMTIWYGVEEENLDYGRKSKLKLRCKNFSPMRGERLYPLFDDYGDMVAMSIGYDVKRKGKTTSYLDTYTKDAHYSFKKEESDEWVIEQEETITTGKIPCIYMHREEPIWEDNSNIVYELEWSVSRNGNFIRKNSKPIMGIFTDEVIKYGDELDGDREFRGLMQLPKGADMKYITWDQNPEMLKIHLDKLEEYFFTMLQLPNWSYEKMSQMALSGESRKQLFIDAKMKVKDESGIFLEFFDREINVVKAFAKIAMGSKYHDAIDQLSVKTAITAFDVDDEGNIVEVLFMANGNKPLMSHRESIERFGMSKDVTKTLEEIRAEAQLDSMDAHF